MIATRAESIASLVARDWIDRLQRERRSDPKDLAGYGFCAYSQNDEDGILQEIFYRIGSTSKTFIEFGCGNGLENNTTYLLLAGWRGAWIDGGAEEIASARQHHAEAIQSGRLTVDCQMLTAENIDSIVSRLGLGGEIDLLSIDIDGNDYWVWSAIRSVIPRVVVIEYNATFRPPADVVQAYRPDAQWDGSNYFGASLSALQRLGELKGFSLVGCSLAGTNAFFVRNDCLGDRFSAPYTAEHHYAPPNYDLFLLSRGHTHPRGSGKYIVYSPTATRP
jgi:hypothetical protein